MIRVWAAAFVGLWVVPGCGPALPGDEATGTTAVETTGAAPTSVVPTSEGTSDGTSEETTDGTSDGSSGEPGPICPEGHASMALQWGLEIPVPDGFELFQVTPGLVRLPDGRIAVAVDGLKGADEWQVGVQFVSALGELQERVMATAPPAFEVNLGEAMVRDDGRLVLVGARREVGAEVGWVGLLSEDGTAVELHDLAEPALNTPRAVVDVDDTTMILAVDRVSLTVWVGAIEAETGATPWATQLPGGLAQVDMAAGPGGEVVVVRGSWDGGPSSELRAWRFTSAGEILWDRTFTPTDPGLGVMGGLTITPDGQVVVLEVWPELGAVFATSLRVVDGAMNWRTKVAASDANGSPRAGGALAAADGTHVIIGQNDEFESLPVTGTVRPLSPGGVLGPVISLDLQQRFGSTVLTPARGPCGEMLVLQLETPGWLGSFAP